MKKPVIAVIPLYDETKESLWMLPGYFDLIREAGGIPLMLPLTLSKEECRQLSAGFDGVLLTGGHDVSPELYGEASRQYCGPVCPPRDALEKTVFETAFKQDKPILGICRGIQLLNVLMGGTLYQDLPAEHPSSVVHHMDRSYDIPAHSITIQKDSPLYAIWKTEEKGVNSCHHQAIKDLASGLSVMATAEDGIVEAVYAPSRNFVMAVQWHPEFSFRRDSQQVDLMKAFVEACHPH